MAEVIKMPRLSDTMTDGVVAKWHKKVGDKKDPGLLDTPLQQFQRGIASFAPQETAAFNLAAQQMGVDPTTGAVTGIAGYQPFIDAAKTGLGTAGTTTALGGQTMQLGIPS